MALQEELKRDGDFLFRYRSYLPLAFLPIFIVAILTQDTYLFHISVLGIGSYNITIIITSIVVGFLGQGIRIWVAGFAPKDTSGRNTRAQIASSINRSGIYSLCRNPLYLGNFLMMLSPIILCGNWLIVLCFALCFWIYYERIIYAEESFLRAKFGEEYLSWANEVPIFIPKFSGYKPSQMSFSLRSTLRREYHSLFGLCSSLFVLHFIIAYVYCWRVGAWLTHINTLLTIIFVISAVFYIVIRLLVKTTTILEVEGRY